jgi:leukotriene-A4 hydrolase
MAILRRHADASHFWLNEGWTTYIERLLQQILHSPAHRGFSFLIGSKMLYDDLKFYEQRNKKYQRLQIEFERGENPDDAYSGVPYEKGANFILHIGQRDLVSGAFQDVDSVLERTLGGLDVFLPYVKDYVRTFMGKSITTEQWKEHLFAYYTQFGQDKIEALKSIDWDVSV